MAYWKAIVGYDTNSGSELSRLLLNTPLCRCPGSHDAFHHHSPVLLNRQSSFQFWDWLGEGRACLTHWLEFFLGLGVSSTYPHSHFGHMSRSLDSPGHRDLLAIQHPWGFTSWERQRGWYANSDFHRNSLNLTTGVQWFPWTQEEQPVPWKQGFPLTRLFPVLMVSLTDTTVSGRSSLIFKLL